jgi:hypothetical protein
MVPAMRAPETSDPEMKSRPGGRLMFLVYATVVILLCGSSLGYVLLIAGMCWYGSYRQGRTMREQLRYYGARQRAWITLVDGRP